MTTNKATTIRSPCTTLNIHKMREMLELIFPVEISWKALLEMKRRTFMFVIVCMKLCFYRWFLQSQKCFFHCTAKYLWDSFRAVLNDFEDTKYIVEFCAVRWSRKFLADERSLIKVLAIIWEFFWKEIKHIYKKSNDWMSNEECLKRNTSAYDTTFALRSRFHRSFRSERIMNQ